MFLYGLDVSDSVIENSTISGNQRHRTPRRRHLSFTTSTRGADDELRHSRRQFCHRRSPADRGGVLFPGVGHPATINNSIFADNIAPPARRTISVPTPVARSIFATRWSSAKRRQHQRHRREHLQPRSAARRRWRTTAVRRRRSVPLSPVPWSMRPIRGSAPPPPTDQRGEPRFYPTRADMGALELVGGVIQFNPTVYSVAENAGSVTLTVVRDVGPDPASVDFTTNPGTATPASATTTRPLPAR